jgi:hypothetical protein
VTDEVRGALRALATGERDDRRDGQCDRAVVAEAATACVDVRAAAAFVDDGGLDRLRRAVEAADRRGDAAVADRGRAILARIERCRRAAADHFRSGRGTVFTDRRQGPDG